MIALVGAMAQTEEKGEVAPSEKPDSLSQEEAAPAGQTVIVSYFHGNRRCGTCMKLEAYSKETIQTNFKQELADSSVIWRTVNYDEEDNKHYIDDYGMYTKSLILSRVSDGKDVEWKNLDKIWQLVKDKDKFMAYVQAETRDFIKAEKK
jgi:hypothetical protein